MALVTDVAPRTQQTYGKFKPKSDLKKFGVAWAAVDGPADSKWPSLGEITSLGQSVGSEGRASLVYEEARFANNKTNDINVGGVTLREVRVPIEEIKKVHRVEAEESNDMLRQFHKRDELNRSQAGTGIKIEELKSAVEDTSKHIPETENTPVT